MVVSGEKSIPVCIAGMHRSGTSMVAKLLHNCGLHLGEGGDLLPPSADNLDGYWEHLAFVRLNEALLHELKGAWDNPPPFTPADLEKPTVIALQSEAHAFGESFAKHGVWGWKDPRNSITLPFWQKALGNLKVVICIRNPLEVVLSLRKRGFPSVSRALDLWAAYTRRTLDDVPRSNRIVTHYDAYFARPAVELKRVVEFARLPASDQVVRDQAGPIKSLRHGWLRTKHLKDVGVPRHILDLYESVCAEAGWDEPSGDVGAAVGQFETSPAREVEVLRIDMEVESLRTRVEARDEVISQLRSELQTAREVACALQLGLARAEAELGLLREIALAAFERSAPDLVQLFRYHQLVIRVRAAIEESVPQLATVLIIGKGDDELLRLPGRKAYHFPQTETGEYAGTYPATGSAAVAHLESLQARGADYLVIPETSMWWLEHYPEFTAHLREFREVARRDGICRIFALNEHADAGPTVQQVSLDEAITRCLEQVPEDPAVLDWNSGLDLNGIAKRWAVFSPPEAGERLPYLDGSVAIVAVPSDRSRAVEARRVAQAAVVTAVPPNESVQSFRLDWISDRAELKKPAVRLIVSSPADSSSADRFWARLIDNLPTEFAGEIVTDSGASFRRVTDQTLLPREVARSRGESDASFFNRVAGTATEDVLIFLASSVLPLNGWLPPLCDILRDPTVGAVGGKVFAPDGRLEGAGAVIFSDGSVRNFGAGDYQVEDPLYEFVREAACSSGHVLATRRASFAELGGFDPVFRTPACAFADYCFRVRGRGMRVCYQPESRFVLSQRPAVETMSPADADGLDRDAFCSKWRPELGSMPRSRPIWDRNSWQSLAVS